MNNTALFRLKSSITRTRKETIFNRVLFASCKIEMKASDIGPPNKNGLYVCLREGEGCKSSGEWWGEGTDEVSTGNAAGERPFHNISC